ncbi:MAG: TadE-like protein [Thermoleophilia bacterium]|nr:TadE-like protein [Thermoleophilia bacterium]MCZ4495889.1 TadE-like protein [Thermoleophilia bacterium]
MVEFAIVLPLLILILFGTIEFGQLFWTSQQVSAAASEGARRASVSRTSATRTADVATAVRNASPNLDSANMTINTNTTWASGTPVTVSVSYELDSFGAGVLGAMGFDGTLDSRRTARVEQ